MPIADYTEESLSAIIEALPLAICVINRDRLLVLANQRVQTLTGKDNRFIIGEIRGRALGCIHSGTPPEECGCSPECDGCKMQQTVLSTMETKKGAEGVELSMTFKGSGQKDLRISTAAITFNGSDAVLLCMQDRTRDREFDRMRVEGEKLSAVVETAGMISHEISQPLMVIMGFAELMLDRMTPDDADYNACAEIKKQGERLSRILKRLTGITRYETKPYLKGKIIDIEKSSEG